MSAPDHAVLLAAGEGSRCWPLTETRAKPLLPVGSQTLLSRLISQVGRAGVETATVVAPSKKGPVAEHALETGERVGVNVDVAVQDEPRGTGHALRQANPPAGRLLVVNGDLLLPRGALQAVADAGEAVVAGARVPDVSEYGALETSGDRLTGLTEKPDRSEAGLVNAGVYVLDEETRSLLDQLDESPRGEIELTDAIEAQAGTHANVRVHELDEWLDVGWPWDLIEANRRALQDVEPRLAGKVEAGVSIEGPVRVEQGATVRSGSVIEGPALIRSGASVGPNAYVRGATTIGREAKVGHACEVKNSLLFEGAQVPHVSYVGDSVLGSDVNLGAGTQVANLRHDEANIQADTPKGRQDTGRRKFGVALGADVKTGINATLNVGVLLGPGETVKPGETVVSSRLPDNP